MRKLILAALQLALACSLSCGGGSGGGGGGGGGTVTKYTVTIMVTGDNNSNGVYDAPLDDWQVPLDGNEAIYCVDSTVTTPPASAPQMTWNNTIHAFTHTLNNVTAAQLKNYWVLVAEPDPGSAAPPGSLSPVTGVFLQVTNEEGDTCTDILVHLVIVGEDSVGNYVYGYQIQSLNPVTDCIEQGADNRSIIFGTGLGG